ncbi:putative bacteriophage protein [Candidatus Glomeribacter gigasporarum BEG34]|uniref:Putative bacteriophage protein n=1 Tax=Candidatus Glomeribacter gigasporarum BEG34 TaxID=1070319 RepID=G2J769_9BURK|nr:hypothetical protein [Candidatus Glomeribacter gigasporarum]CCD28609.1 putative bacteriophage protein [Candidatus Glomeribacter gigasporarum BEG34]
MRYRRLDAAGDYAFGRGLSDFEQDTPEAVAQAVKTRLALRFGEWFLDTSDGTPWASRVLGQSAREAVDWTIRERILGTEGVTRINRYVRTFDPNTRALSIQADIDTIYGPTMVNMSDDPFRHD